MKELGDLNDLEFSVKVTDVNGKVTHQHMRYSVDGQNSVFAMIAIQIIWRAVQGDIRAFKILLNRTEGRVPAPIRRIADCIDPIIDHRSAQTADQLRSELTHVRARIAQPS